jgi:hypothetical protein
MHLLLISARTGVGLVFLAAGVVKLLARGNGQTMFWNLFPPGSVGAYLLISVEILLGIWLLSGLGSRIAAAAAGLLLCIFTASILLELRKPNPNPCGCFILEVTPQGVADARRSLRRSLGRNVALVVLCGIVASASGHPVPRRGGENNARRETKPPGGT